MKNVYEVLRQKELELARLEKEVEALRVAAPLLSEDKEMLAEGTNNKPAITAQQPIRMTQPPRPSSAACSTCDPSVCHSLVVSGPQCV
jgi:hypothetical protein